MRTRLLLWDFVAVTLFVVVGRRTHQEGLTFGAILETLAPFVGGLALGWVAGFRSDLITLKGGVVVASVTTGVGMLLRRFVAGDGTAPAFVVVTTLFLFATMLGWRLVLPRRPAASLPAESRGA